MCRLYVHLSTHAESLYAPCQLELKSCEDKTVKVFCLQGGVKQRWKNRGWKGWTNHRTSEMLERCCMYCTHQNGQRIFFHDTLHWRRFVPNFVPKRKANFATFNRRSHDWDLLVVAMGSRFLKGQLKLTRIHELGEVLAGEAGSIWWHGRPSCLEPGIAEQLLYFCAYI